MKVGIKRLLLCMMLTAVPLVSANTISSLQETVEPAVFVPSISVARKTDIPNPVVKKRMAIKKPNLVSFGIASWYSESDPGINVHTANGEVFDETQMTCASWNFAFGTRLKITNLSNGKSVICRVNDRGPAKRLRRVVDLTKSAFRKIADPRRGLVRVSVRPLDSRK